MNPKRPKDFDDAFRDDERGEAFLLAKAAADEGPPIVASQEASWPSPVPLLRGTSIKRFPTDALPAWLRQFVEEVAEATQTPPDVAAMLALAVVGAAVAGRVRIQGWAGYSEPLNVFVVVVLPPANRKSSVHNLVTAPLYRFEDEEGQRLAPEIRAAATRRKIAEDRAHAAEAAAVKAKENQAELERAAIQAAADRDAIVVPRSPRLVVDDCTPESLAQLLSEHQGRIAVASSEGGVFEQMGGRYSRQATPNLDVYLKGHAGDALRVDRIGRPSEKVDEPALTLALTVQPDVIQGLANKPGFRGRGLLGRCVYSLPVSRVGSRSFDAASVSPAAASTYQAQVGSLLTKSSTLQGPRTLSVTPPATEALKAYARALEPRLAEDADLGTIADWAGKLVGAVLRIAGILHLAEHAHEPDLAELPVTVPTVEDAIRIGEYLEAHAKVAFGMMGADPNMAGARQLLAWLRSAPPAFSEREAFNGTRGRFRNMDEVRAAIEVLVQHGYVRREAQAPQGPGRPPSPQLVVNPKWDRG